MIHTSYFANAKNIHTRQISISRFSPKWLKIYEAKELAPSISLLNMYKKEEINEIEYERIYREETLSKLDPKEIYHKYNDCTLMCYEKRGDFCHRYILAKWLSDAGFEIKEVENQIKLGIICSDNYNEINTISYLLKNYIKKNPNIKIITSTNNAASTYAKEHNIQIEEYCIDWNKNNTSAKYINTKEIITNSDIVLVFWDGVSENERKSFDITYTENKICFVFHTELNKFIPRIIKSNILKFQYHNIICFSSFISDKDNTLDMINKCSKKFKSKFKNIDTEFKYLDPNFGYSETTINGERIAAFQIKNRKKTKIKVIKNSIKIMKEKTKKNDNIAICCQDIDNKDLSKQNLLSLFSGLTNIDLFFN